MIQIFDNRKTGYREVIAGEMQLYSSHATGEWLYPFGHYPDHPDNAPKPARDGGMDWSEKIAPNRPPKEPTLYVPQAVGEKVTIPGSGHVWSVAHLESGTLARRDEPGRWEVRVFADINGAWLAGIAPHTEPRKPRVGYLEEGFMRVEPGYPVPAIELTPEVSDALAKKGLLP